MKRTLNFFVILVIFALFTLFTLGSCSREQSVETDEGKMTVKEEGEKIKVTTEEGTITMSGDEEKGQIAITTEEGETLNVSYGKDSIPDNFPKDVPVYSPATVKMTQIIDDSKSVISLGTQDDVSKVATFYKKELSAKGWSVKNEMSMGSMSLLHVQKGSRALNVTVNKSDEETIISMVIGETE
jgi:hypothetical protein